MLRGLFACCAALALSGAVALGGACAPARSSATKLDAAAERVERCTGFVDEDCDGISDSREAHDVPCAAGACHGAHHGAHRCW